MERKIRNLYCPKCGEEMEEGYVHSRKQILWSEDGKSRLYDLYDENLVPMGVRRSNKVPGLRCKECKLVLFEYER
ncbi:MAG: hypothetical protein GX339_00095 [Tissierellia bacterium]|nr:hypothetical protein [Tissierellia bacterium]